MQNLQGYKTYILAAAIAATVIAKHLGYLDENTANTILTLLGAGTATTLAAKINRTEQIAKLTASAAIQTNSVIQPLVTPSQAGRTMRSDAGVTGGSVGFVSAGTHPSDSTNYGRNTRK